MPVSISPALTSPQVFTGRAVGRSPAVDNAGFCTAVSRLFTERVPSVLKACVVARASTVTSVDMGEAAKSTLINPS